MALAIPAKIPTGSYVDGYGRVCSNGIYPLDENGLHRVSFVGEDDKVFRVALDPDKPLRFLPRKRPVERKMVAVDLNMLKAISDSDNPAEGLAELVAKLAPKPQVIPAGHKVRKG